jgi:hypothetical protein
MLLATSSDAIEIKNIRFECVSMTLRAIFACAYLGRDSVGLALRGRRQEEHAEDAER